MQLSDNINATQNPVAGLGSLEFLARLASRRDRAFASGAESQSDHGGRRSDAGDRQPR